LQKKKIAALSFATVLFIAGWAVMPLYIMAILFLGWRAYFVFPPLLGLLAWGMIYFYDEDKTLADFIEGGIKSGSTKRILLYLFEHLKWAALVFSALFLSWSLTPILVKLCLKDNGKRYIWGVVLNVISSALWVWIYLGGKNILEYCFGVITN